MGGKSEFVGVSVPIAISKAIKDAVENSGIFKTKSELMRTALREKLSDMGYLREGNGQ